MKQTDDTIAAEAAAWHIASLDEAMDWDGFTRWLEADPRHSQAYDDVALADAALVEHRGSVAAALAANDDAADRPANPSRTWLGWTGAAVAASLAAAMLVPQFASGGGTTYQSTGEGRLIALADGSSVQLAPFSRLEVSGDGARMTVDGGAWFAVRHDPSRPLSIRAGALEISDIGTRFDVQAAAGEVRVEVAEGEVSVSGDALTAPVTLGAGRALAFDPTGGTATVHRVPAEDIGEWRSGRLSFDGAPLSLVAADLSRYAGVQVTVAENLAGRRFTGTLVIDDGHAALRDLSQLMDVELGRNGDGYRLEPRAR